MLNSTWSCHICGNNRNDENISVATGMFRGLPGAEVNIRYCNDNFDCELLARKSAVLGKFPKSKKVVPVKKWYQFWK